MRHRDRQLSLFDEAKIPAAVSTRVDTCGILAGPKPFAWADVESECGAWVVDDLHRLLLWRSWSKAPRALFAMLNPSTADASVDDPTIRRCMAFARSWGCGGINVVNLYSLIETDPELLWQAEPHLRLAPERALQPAAGAHAEVYRGAIDRSLGPLVMAWGGVPPRAQDRVDELVGAVWTCKRAAFCLGTTTRGQPKHPLYLAAATQLVPILGKLLAQ
jgi:hypothetical protein